MIKEINRKIKESLERLYKIIISSRALTELSKKIDESYKSSTNNT
jgi:hypothetical protein